MTRRLVILLALFCALASPAVAQVSSVNTKDDEGFNSFSSGTRVITLGWTSTANNWISGVCGIANGTAVDVSNITDSSGSTTYTIVQNRRHTDPSLHSRGFAFWGRPSTGITTLSVNLASAWSSSQHICKIRELTGIDTTTAVDVSGSNDDDAGLTDHPLTVTVGSANGYALGVTISTGVSTWTIDAAFTDQFQDGGGRGVSGVKAAPSVGSFTMTNHSTNARNAVNVLMVMKAAAGAAPAPQLCMFLGVCGW